MVKLDRRMFANAALLGVLLTLLVAGADAVGLLTPLERWLYDQRALWCQHWTPPPTDRLVHVDIDDAALDSIGHWPWDRTDVAEILDELRLAGAKAVGLDVLFSEPQRPTLVMTNKSIVTIDHDRRLAEAVEALSNCVVAASFPFQRETVDPLYAAVEQALFKNPELDEAQAARAVRPGGRSTPEIDERVRGHFYSALCDALYRRIRGDGPGVDAETLRNKLLPATDPFVDTMELLAFREAFARAEAADALRRHAVPIPAAGETIADATLAEAPVAPLGRAASGAGFVDYTQSSDGRVRSVPLLLAHDGVVYPQLGVVLAWRLLGADPAQLKIGHGAVTLPRGSLGDLVVPVHIAAANELFSADRDVPLSANLSWFGGRDWSTMYARGRGATTTAQHVPIAAVFDACRVRRRIESNNEEASFAIEMVIPDELYDEFQLRKLPEDDVAGHAARIDRVLANPVMPASDDPKRAEAEAAVEKLRAIRAANPKLHADLEAHRARLRGLFADKAVLIGWTATGVAADFIPTSLHPRCPGVVLHGVVFNQVMTGEVWRTMPQWITTLATVCVGLLATIAVSMLSPGKALLAAAALVAGYVGLNGYLLFDYGNQIIGAAGPVIAVGAVFTGGTLAKLAIERWERARITRRFSSYVDPRIVDYVVKHPNLVHFEGQVREMTVVFCDVAGFTNLTETHGSETVQMLNQLWGVMVPVIRRNGGIVNKFLGDGIMFFFGAPEQSPGHARDAVAAVLAMREALARFNEQVAAQRKWPALALRFGVSTGTMVVGDAGSADTGSGTRAADYTVLGDNVNLGSRLEGANKAVGTSALVTARTVELSAAGAVLFRPIGNLRVVGKKEGVVAFEPVARTGEATDAQKRLAADSKAMVDAFIAGRFAQCVEVIDRLEHAHGRGKLTALYRERCEWLLRNPSTEPFDGQIVLTEK